MKYYILLAILSMATLSCKSQVEKKQSKNEILNLIYEFCPTADVLEIEKKSDNYVEIEYLCNEKVVEVGIVDNKVIYQETEADKSDVPYAKIIHKIEKKYPSWILDEINQVTANGETFLKVEIVKGGIEQNLFFTTEGKRYQANSIIISDKWNAEMLASSPVFTQANYSFLKPDAYYEMPDLLREVSGIAMLNSENMLCVQDELGIVFKYNLKTEYTENFHRFTDKGDFEDIALSGDTVHVLRSDGAVFSFDRNNKQNSKQTALSVASLNVEGLFYNANDNYMYLVSKESEVFKNEKEAHRPVYRYRNDGQYTLETYFEINTKAINQSLYDNHPSLKKQDVQFNPSAIAIHPKTQSFFVLSANDRLLAVYDSNNQLAEVYPLPAELYYKPEGLAFGTDGTLFISNEGDKIGLIKGNILAFRYVVN